MEDCSLLKHKRVEMGIKMRLSHYNSSFYMVERIGTKIGNSKSVSFDLSKFFDSDTIQNEHDVADSQKRYGNILTYLRVSTFQCRFFP